MFKIFLIVAFLVGCTENTSVSDLKIVGGERLQSMDDKGASATVGFYSRISTMCTGTLIGPKHIVTAAHCFGNGARPTEIFFGPKKSALKVKILGYKAHESYQRNGGQNLDIGVIAFEGDLPSSLEPAVLAASDDVEEGANILVVGYGVSGEHRNDSGILRSVETSIMQVNDSDKEFEQQTGGGGSCYGDSGGPVYVLNGKPGLHVVGATSRGGNCDRGDGVYTDVTKYKDWMQETFDELNAPIDFESIQSGSDLSRSVKLAINYNKNKPESSAMYMSHLKSTNSFGFCVLDPSSNDKDCENARYNEFASSSVKGASDRVIVERKNVGKLNDKRVVILESDSNDEIVGRAVFKITL